MRKIVVSRDHDACLALDRLDDEGCRLLAVRGQGGFEIGNVVKADRCVGGGIDSGDVGDVRAVVIARLRIG